MQEDRNMTSLYWLVYVSLNDGSENFVSISNSHLKIDYIRYLCKGLHSTGSKI